MCARIYGLRTLQRLSGAISSKITDIESGWVFNFTVLCSARIYSTSQQCVWTAPIGNGEYINAATIGNGEYIHTYIGTYRTRAVERANRPHVWIQACHMSPSIPDIGATRSYKINGSYTWETFWASLPSGHTSSCRVSRARSASGSARRVSPTIPNMFLMHALRHRFGTFLASKPSCSSNWAAVFLKCWSTTSKSSGSMKHFVRHGNSCKFHKPHSLHPNHYQIQLLHHPIHWSPSSGYIRVSRCEWPCLKNFFEHNIVGWL